MVSSSVCLLVNFFASKSWHFYIAIILGCFRERDHKQSLAVACDLWADLDELLVIAASNLPLPCVLGVFVDRMLVVAVVAGNGGSHALSAMIAAEGSAAGFGQGELQAQIGNFRSVLGTVSGLAWGWIYGAGSRRGAPGLFFLVALGSTFVQLGLATRPLTSSSSME